MQATATRAAGRAGPADEIRQALAAPSAAVLGLTLPALVARCGRWSTPFVLAAVAELEQAGELETDATQKPMIVRLAQAGRVR